jgi:hypothetical protein
MKQQLDEGNLRFPPVILFTDGQDYWLKNQKRKIKKGRDSNQGKTCQSGHQDYFRAINSPFLLQ